MHPLLLLPINIPSETPRSPGTWRGQRCRSTSLPLRHPLLQVPGAQHTPVWWDGAAPQDPHLASPRGPPILPPHGSHSSTHEPRLGWGLAGGQEPLHCSEEVLGDPAL